MPHSFDMSFESPATVEEVYAAFSDRGYWLDRLVAFGGAKSLDSLDVDAGGTVRVIASEDLRRGVLPGILSKLYRGDLTIRSTEVWSMVGDGRVSGEIGVAVVGAPGAGGGTAMLQPSAGGSQLSLSTTVEFNVPLVGGRMESYVAGLFAAGFADIHRFTDSWIAARA